MAKNYIWSNANRFYAAVEDTYGVPAAITAQSRFPAVSLHAHQVLQMGRRRDKTGTRTLMGAPASGKRASAFEVTTYLTSWNGGTVPGYGAFVQAALGSAPEFGGGLVLAQMNGTTVQTTIPHLLSVGSVLSTGGELRFVAQAPDAQTVILNAPFTANPSVGLTFSSTVGYRLATALPSLTLFDYWDPAGAVSRLITGAGVDRMQILVNGDYHEMVFSGPSADVVDSASGNFGVSGLTAFPAEPALGSFDYSIVPGHLGQAWIGAPASEVFTLTEARVEIHNNLTVRNQEFGSSFPLGMAPGPRQVTVNLTLFAQDGSETAALYSAARNRSPIQVGLQLGQQQGQLMSVFLPAVVPEMPLFDDTQKNLQWQFKGCLAQGKGNDEIYVAFA